MTYISDQKTECPEQKTLDTQCLFSCFFSGQKKERGLTYSMPDI